jgi:hypothetical protein
MSDCCTMLLGSRVSVSVCEVGPPRIAWTVRHMCISNPQNAQGSKYKQCCSVNDASTGAAITVYYLR